MIGALRKPWVIVDIDHTLSNSTPRDRYLNSDRLDCQSLNKMTEEEWHMYHRNCYLDEPNWDVVRLVNGLWSSGYSIALFTARSEDYKQETEWWMDEHNIQHEVLCMRPTGSKKTSPELKIDMARALLGSAFADRVLCVIDDHPDVIEAFRKHGVTGFIVKACESQKENA